MVEDTKFFSQPELEVLFGSLTDTTDPRIFCKDNSGLGFAQGKLFFVAGFHFGSPVKQSYFATDITEAKPDRLKGETDEEYSKQVKTMQKNNAEIAFKKMQDACQLVVDTGSWPVPF